MVLTRAAAGPVLTWSPEGTPGGSGVWDADTGSWTGEAVSVGWQAGADALFPAPSGLVMAEGVLEAGSLNFEGAGYRLSMDHLDGTRLGAVAVLGRPEFNFRGLIGADADSYPAVEELRAVGLHLRPEGWQRVEATLVPVEGGSPVFGVSGADGVAEFAGRWISDTGSIISWLVLDEGGHLVLGEDADMRFIKEGFFTLQLWVSGDGTGTLELAPGFVADRTEGGSTRLGIGSIRMGGGTLISHASRNLPLGYRPREDGTAQTNGHLVFENRSGSRWRVTGEDQVYPGAVWIHRDMELIAERDLVHVGVSESSSNYMARNGWSVLAAATVTKSGPGALVLAGEQSYAPGSVLRIDDGSVVMRTDPAAGRSLYGTVTGGQLGIEVGEGALFDWATDGAIGSLVVNGEFRWGGRMELLGDAYAEFGASSRTRLNLDDGLSQPLMETVGVIFVSGELVVTRDPGYFPAPGSEWVLGSAGAILGEWTLIDETGLGLAVVSNGVSLRLVSSAEAPDLPGEVWLEDDFEAPQGLWKDLSTVPRWGSPLAHGSAFEWTGGVVRLQRSGARDTTAYTAYDTSAGLKTFTALDHQFARPAAHAGSEVTVDFRLRWPAPTASTGEGGRVIFALNHDYPEGGLDLTPEGTSGTRLSDFSAAWWARPTYHVRLRNGTTRSGSTFLQYGGGKDPEGEYESTAGWWLPGFISGAGQIAPGDGEEFPANSWVATREGMARETFTRFRYRVLPDRQELWRDTNDDGMLTDDERVATMPLPAESAAPFYQYFPQFEGLRIFWNGREDSAAAGDSGQMELDWVRVTVQENLSPVAEAGPDLFAAALVEGRAIVRLDAGASSDPEGDPLRFHWYGPDGLLAWSTEAVTYVTLPAGEHLLELLAIDSAGNAARDQTTVSVSLGKVRPVADAGSDQTVTAVNEWFGFASVSGAASFSPDGSLVRYQWSMTAGERVLYDGADPLATLALEVGSHLLTLTVWDAEGVSAEDTVRVVVESASPPKPAVAVYRENFSRPSNGTEMGVDSVGWRLTQYNGEPVPAIRYNGNAHRSLSAGTPAAPYQTRIAANPTSLEYDAPNAYGHAWMNQMPFLNATPAEWMLWTDEYTLDRSVWDLAEIRFHSLDESPEQVKVAPAVRIDDRWYIGWDLRIETRRTSYFAAHVLPLAPTGWYLFEPSATFSVREARPVSRLPDGNIEAFGFYFFKDYGWYVNSIDNFALWVRLRDPERPYGRWLIDHFTTAQLAVADASAIWKAERDPDGDGWTNLWEYALGSDPNLPGHPDLRSSISPDGLTLTCDLPRNPAATDLDFLLQSSTDLENWSSRGVVAEDYADPETGAPRMRLRADLPGGPQHFFRWVPAFNSLD